MNKLILTLLLMMIKLTKMDISDFILNKLIPTPKPIRANCAQYTAQLTSLFTLTCDNIANGEDNVLRDSCVGCFQRSSTASNNQPSLEEIRGCAQIYLTDTRYGGCITELTPTPPTAAPGACVTGYCPFVSCIRRVHSNLLIAQCYEQASADNEAVFEEDQIQLVKDVTSCILARARCQPINPITGQSQSSRFTTTTYDKWGKPVTTIVPLYNTLQITPEGDLRIVRLPGTTRIQNYFCTRQPANLRESSWMEFSC